jgi:hypothetical protein
MENKMDIINVVNYGWLNENKLDGIIELVGGETTTDKFIDNLKLNKYDNVASTIYKLNLEDRLIIADKFNSEIRKDCLNTIREDMCLGKTEIERHNWLDTLSVIPRELLRITYKEKVYQLYV